MGGCCPFTLLALRVLLLPPSVGPERYMLTPIIQMAHTGNSEANDDSSEDTKPGSQPPSTRFQPSPASVMATTGFCTTCHAIRPAENRPPSLTAAAAAGGGAGAVGGAELGPRVLVMLPCLLALALVVVTEAPKEAARVRLRVLLLLLLLRAGGGGSCANPYSHRAKAAGLMSTSEMGAIT